MIIVGGIFLMKENGVRLGCKSETTEAEGGHSNFNSIFHRSMKIKYKHSEPSLRMEQSDVLLVRILVVNYSIEE